MTCVCARMFVNRGDLLCNTRVGGDYWVSNMKVNHALFNFPFLKMMLFVIAYVHQCVRTSMHTASTLHMHVHCVWKKKPAHFARIFPLTNHSLLQSCVCVCARVWMW